MNVALQHRPLARQSATAQQPRADGSVRLSARLRAGRSRIDRLRQQGSAKALLPATPGPALEAVLLNTAGGITGGDRFSYSLTAQEGAWLGLASQTAERAYRAQPDQTGRVDVHLTAGPGARIDWLAQETILFEGARLVRRFEADLAGDATLLAVEPLVFGRTARGERLRDVALSDQWRIRRDGRLVFADALRLCGDAEAAIAGPGSLAGMRASATVLMAGPGAARLLAPLRASLPDTAGASLVQDDLIAARICASDCMSLRRLLVPALALLRGTALPKVWSL